MTPDEKIDTDIEQAEPTETSDTAAAEITDNDPEKRSLKGVLALQLHAGPAMKLEVKGMSLQKVE